MQQAPVSWTGVLLWRCWGPQWECPGKLKFQHAARWSMPRDEAVLLSGRWHQPSMQCQLRRLGERPYHGSAGQERCHARLLSGPAGDLHSQHVSLRVMTHHCAPMIVSMLSAMRSRLCRLKLMPSVPMLIASDTPTVLKRYPTMPGRKTHALP